MLHVVIASNAEQVIRNCEMGLRADRGIRIIGTYNELQQLRACATTSRVDVVILDLQLKNGNKPITVFDLLRASPHSTILALCSPGNPHGAYHAVLSGALGCVRSDCTSSELATAVHQVRAGGSPLASEVARQIVLALQATVRFSPIAHRLTRREFEIMHYIMAGYTYSAVASAMEISPETVRTHVRNAYRKLGVNKRSEAYEIMIA